MWFTALNTLHCIIVDINLNLLLKEFECENLSKCKQNDYNADWNRACKCLQTSPVIGLHFFNQGHTSNCGCPRFLNKGVQYGENNIKRVFRAICFLTSLKGKGVCPPSVCRLTAEILCPRLQVKQFRSSFGGAYRQVCVCVCGVGVGGVCGGWGGPENGISPSHLYD